ncbi:MAG: serine/threonine-protein kinase [Phycisphaeraceae bacterium]|nr:serine/threonine-protein kinase [Phycisphaerales bacterium]MCB9841622.1 serine/threonine-protein kinase [Phycisphaeraceae bacterium]
MPDRIGPFDILSELGRGGMGVVHLARDTRLDRHVAIKALPEHLTTDPVRLERFEREARTLAALHHPNIAGIHGVEEQDGARYLILEFVPGHTLADLLDRGPLPVDDAIEHAAQIAAGLEAAHEAGIVHRDLKPANIRITPDGVAKILDFGLARADDGAQSSAGGLDSPTLTTPHPMHSPTIEGAILGTAAYMSPEQARGRRVDKRSDIWSFGVVLYEMLVGSSPFHGETAMDSIGAVLHRDVDLAALPPATPPGVARVLAQCLQRDKSLRFRDIGDVRLELLDARHHPEAPAPMGRAARSLALPIGVLAIVLGAIGGWFGARSTTPEPERRVRKFDLAEQSPTQSSAFYVPAVSPDGTRVAYIVDDDVFVRDMGSFETRTLAQTSDPSGLVWSPDSRHLAIFGGSGILKANVNDGSMIELSKDAITWGVTGGGWSTDDRIIFADDDGIFELPAKGGTPRILLASDHDTEVDFHYPVGVPGSTVVLFIQHNRDSSYVLQAFDGDRRVNVIDAGEPPITQCAYSPTGHIVFSRGFGESTVWAVPFDVRSMRATGEPFLVLNDATMPSVSQDGTLVVVRGDQGAAGEMAIYGVDGSVTRLGEPREYLWALVLSNDERKIAYNSGKSPNKSDVWIYDRERGTNTRLTFEQGMCAPVAWSPDDSELAVLHFTPTGTNVFTTSFHHTDGSGPSREPVMAGLISFDARWENAAVQPEPAQKESAIRAVRLNDPETFTTVIHSEHLEFGPQLSPDGTLLAYISTESGERNLYCTSFPSGHGKWLISDMPVESSGWSADGSAIYFTTKDSRMMRVGVERQPSVQFGLPEVVFEYPRSPTKDAPEFQWVRPIRDGSAFLAVLRNQDESQPNRISVIENWFEEFRTSKR